MNFRNRIEHSTTLAWVLSGIVGTYLSIVEKTTRWQVQGEDDLRAALAEGPVVIVMWHTRSLMGASHWPKGVGTLSSLYAASPIGRVSGALQRRCGLQPIEMADNTSNIAASRVVLGRAKAGISIGLTGDGPLGPALELKDAPLEWARSTRLPVFAYAFSSNKARTLDTWDDMMMPLPFGRGAKVYLRLSEPLTRKPDAATASNQRASLASLLSQAIEEADTLAGVTPDDP